MVQSPRNFIIFSSRHVEKSGKGHASIVKKYHTRDNDLFGGSGLIVFKLFFVRQNEGYTFSHSHSIWLIPGRAVEEILSKENKTQV